MTFQTFLDPAQIERWLSVDRSLAMFLRIVRSQILGPAGYCPARHDSVGGRQYGDPDGMPAIELSWQVEFLTTPARPRTEPRAREV